jgi:hypothetical protein
LHGISREVFEPLGVDPHHASLTRQIVFLAEVALYGVEVREAASKIMTLGVEQ